MIGMRHLARDETFSQDQSEGSQKDKPLAGT